MRYVWMAVLVVGIAVGPAAAQEAGRFRENLEVGLTFLDLGQYQRAAAYLGKAYAEKPKDAEAGVAYAAALLRLGRVDDAVTLLRKFDTPEAAYYLAEALKKQGKTAEARAAYEKAAAGKGALSARAMLEAGRLASSAGDYGAARSNFERVLELDAAGELVAEAKKELGALAGKKGPFGVSASAGVRYDSNVRLAQERASGDGGMRVVAALQGSARLVDAKGWKSEAVASIDQGRFLKPDLQALDFGAHRLQANLNYKPGKLPVRMGAEAFVQYNTLDFATYSLGAGAGPQVLVAEGDHFATTAGWTWRKDNFATAFDGRDAVVSDSAVSQFVFWGRTGYAGAGGDWQFNRARGQDFQYRIVTLRGFAGGELGPAVQLDGGVDFTMTPYNKVDRIERTLTGSVGVGKFWGSLGVRASGAFVSNNSTAAPNVPRFDFHKTVVGLDVRWRY
jgi:tetratricopeptide (TPR) repeat protein